MDFHGALPRVKSLVPGKAAAQVDRISVGDVLTAVNRKSTFGQCDDELRSSIVGPVGTKVLLAFERGGSYAFEVFLIRGGLNYDEDSGTTRSAVNKSSDETKDRLATNLRSIRRNRIAIRILVAWSIHSKAALRLLQLVEFSSRAAARERAIWALDTWALTFAAVRSRLRRQRLLQSYTGWRRRVSFAMNLACALYGLLRRRQLRAAIAILATWSRRTARRRSLDLRAGPERGSVAARAWASAAPATDTFALATS